MPELVPLAVAAGLCVVVAALEGAVTGDGPRTWYPGLRKPWWQIPLWASILVGLVVYGIDGFVAYRVLTAVPAPKDQVVAMTALVVVMLLNALWNLAFFRSRSTLIGFLGILGFLGPVLVLQVALFAHEPIAAWAHMVYTAYLVFYDVPLFYALWRMNPEQ